MWHDKDFNSQAEEMVAIPISEYKELRKRDRILEALEAGGVDDWTYYSDALHQYYPELFNEEAD